MEASFFCIRRNTWYLTHEKGLCIFLSLSGASYSWLENMKWSGLSLAASSSWRDLYGMTSSIPWVVELVNPMCTGGVKATERERESSVYTHVQHVLRAFGPVLSVNKTRHWQLNPVLARAKSNLLHPLWRVRPRFLPLWLVEISPWLKGVIFNRRAWSLRQCVSAGSSKA